MKRAIMSCGRRHRQSVPLVRLASAAAPRGAPAPQPEPLAMRAEAAALFRQQEEQQRQRLQVRHPQQQEQQEQQRMLPQALDRAPPRVEPAHLPTTALIERSATGVSLQWADGHQSLYHAKWLRANCPANFHSTGQRLFSSGDVPADLQIAAARIAADPDGAPELHVDWATTANHHTSRFKARWLRQHCYTPAPAPTPAAASRPLRSLCEPSQVPSLAYDELLAGGNGKYKWLRAVTQQGLCLVKDVPTMEGMVNRVAEMVAPVSHSFLYGKTFDVKASKDPVNIAYTDLGLGLHQDLSYYESPPGMQMLHCLSFDPSVQGGCSTFFDAHLAAELLRERSPDAFAVLTRVPCTFLKDHAQRARPANMRYKRPHISVNAQGEVISVFWSPQFEGPLEVSPDDVEPYFDAYRQFQEILEDADVLREHLIEMRLTEGDLICFNQRRFLHGRGSFTPGNHDATRHLQGTYVNIDELMSEYRVQHRLYGHGVLLETPVGNGAH